MFKNLFCKHEWEIVSSISNCLISNENGKKKYGTRYTCKCSKCNKERIFFESDTISVIKDIFGKENIYEIF